MECDPNCAESFGKLSLYATCLLGYIESRCESVPENLQKPEKKLKDLKNKKNKKPLEKFHTSQLQIHFRINAMHLNIGGTSLCSSVSNRMVPQKKYNQ